jgi:anti-sigma regulatory factor (Ser/Thr protein kinase)
VTSTRAFRCQPEAVTAARRFVRDALREQPPAIVDAAELMASELATNCVRHARTDFEIAIHLRGQIRVEVRDTGPGQPVVRSPTPREPSGRGLRIVEAMADSWGIISSASGKTVWFAFPRHGRGSRGASRLDAASDRAHGGGHRTAHRTRVPWPRGPARSAGEAGPLVDVADRCAVAVAVACDERLTRDRAVGR